MSRKEQRNLAIFVAVVGTLLIGGALLANYSGILRADEQGQPKVSCAGEGKVCTGSATHAAGLPAVHASVDAAPSGGCCSADKAAGCGDCGDKDGGCDGCDGKEGGCDDCDGDCDDKDGGCDDCAGKDSGCGGCSQEPLPASSVEPQGCACGSAH